MAPSGPDKHPVSLQGERDRTIELLSEHFAQDNLTLDQLEQRIDLAYQASSIPALRELTKDLRTDAGAVVARPAAPLPEVFAPERDRIVSIMANTKRRGTWQPPRHLDVWSVMSETLLD